MVKVALIGTHNTGKTTALWQIGAELKKLGIRKVGLVQETVRGCPYPIEEMETFEGANWTMLNQILAEADAQLKYEHVICDRSVIDQIIYFEDRIHNSENANYLRNVAESWMAIRPYDLIFLFIPSPQIPDPRRSSLEWRRKIEERFKKEYPRIPNAYFVTNEKLEDRVSFVIKKILQIVKT